MQFPPLFRQAAEIIQQLKNHGHEAYIVGGAVRDQLLGKPVDDIDLATSAKPEEVRAIFPKTIPVGIEHGTVVVRHHHRSFEVTTFRSESDYEDHRHPSSVAFVSSLEEDLKRRDFTINALAMSQTGEIADPFSGRVDLANGLIRTVGQAEERFNEDPLRMMRAVRFASQLCFQVEEKTQDALKRMASDLQHISVERITIEFEKLLQGKCAEKAFILLLETDLYRYLPGMDHQEDALRKLASVDLGQFLSIEERWAFLIAYMQLSDPVSWLKAWKLSNEKIKEVVRILRFFEKVMNDDDGWDPYSVYQAGLETALSAERLRSVLTKEPLVVDQVVRIYDRLPLKDRRELSVNGNDLLAWHERPPGPWISKRVEAIEKAVVEGSVANEKEAVRKWLSKQTF